MDDGWLPRTNNVWHIDVRLRLETATNVAVQTIECVGLSRDVSPQTIIGVQHALSSILVFNVLGLHVENVLCAGELANGLLQHDTQVSFGSIPFVTCFFCDFTTKSKLRYCDV